MTSLTFDYYKFGDKVSARWDSGLWVPGRVVAVPGTSDASKALKIAISTPNTTSVRNGLRILPPGTPLYYGFEADEVRLKAHDPRWDPFAVRPFATPAEYRILGGSARWQSPGMPGLTHVGAYMPANYYNAGVPVWVWDSKWLPARVIGVQHSWIAARLVGTARTQDGRLSKSFKPPFVWPVLCDHPEPVLQFSHDPFWMRPRDAAQPRPYHTTVVRLA